ncbi:hypothetical protein CAFE_03550 [Caprobacter fermentans]|uniref:Uncharacterized protein n=1 Tax=Caproicibacter fermentans TaxID=2576756 RepID=A0A6N8HVV2_9FIRM|nr:hypothetical protein [Caproicibacter fermentans]MVB09690.1 hypothetical protein [Caproicibacter fermentans]OCN02817.1 hypothetical protein A7X67_02875 [Clostridium sp. W14A]QNK40444.1 hypothetical protein HCR03_17640 [Caproicibacter fermentans]
MERSEEAKIPEFRSLIAAIREEAGPLKDVILSKAEEDEENKILSDFDNAVQIQVFGTLEHLKAYQLNGWRELVDGEDDGGNGPNAAKA